MNKAERLARTEKKIAFREKRMKEVSLFGPGQKHRGHYLAKGSRGLGSCGNTHCSICSIEAETKRLNKKRERREGKLVAGEGIEPPTSSV